MLEVSLLGIHNAETPYLACKLKTNSSRDISDFISVKLHNAYLDY